MNILIQILLGFTIVSIFTFSCFLVYCFLRTKKEENKVRRFRSQFAKSVVAIRDNEIGIDAKDLEILTCFYEDCFPEGAGEYRYEKYRAYYLSHIKEAVLNNLVDPGDIIENTRIIAASMFKKRRENTGRFVYNYLESDTKITLTVGFSQTAHRIKNKILYDSFCAVLDKANDGLFYPKNNFEHFGLLAVHKISKEYLVVFLSANCHLNCDSPTNSVYLLGIFRLVSGGNSISSCESKHTMESSMSIFSFFKSKYTKDEKLYLQHFKELYLSMGQEKADATTSARGLLDSAISMAEKLSLRGVKNVGDLKINDVEFITNRIAAGLSIQDILDYLNRDYVLICAERIMLDATRFNLFMTLTKNGSSAESAMKICRGKFIFYGEPESSHENYVGEDADIYPEFMLRYDNWDRRNPSAKQYSSHNAMVRDLIRAGVI